MAKYRPVYVRIWNDPDFIELSKSGKLLFLYLITNESIQESGIYPTHPATIQNNTGIEKSEIVPLLAEMTARKMIKFDYVNSIIFIINFLKYNGGGRPDLLKKAILKDCKTTVSPVWEYFTVFYQDYEEEIREIINDYPIETSLKEADKACIDADFKPLANRWQTVGKPLANSSVNGWQTDQGTVGKQINRNRNSSSNSNSFNNNNNKYINKVEEYFSGDDLKKNKVIYLETYELIDVDKEIKKARSWLISNLSKQKKDFRRFLNNWLAAAEKDAQANKKQYGGNGAVDYSEAKANFLNS